MKTTMTLKAIVTLGALAILVFFLGGCGARPTPAPTHTPRPTATPTPTHDPALGPKPTPRPRRPADPHRYDYAPYGDFFVRYFGNPLISFGMFVFWLTSTILGFMPLRVWRLAPAWLRWPKLGVHVVTSVLVYLAFGALVAPAYVAAPDFLYAPDAVWENLARQGWMILLWPLVVLMCANAC